MSFLPHLQCVLQLVAGSAIQAFEEVCPERIDLIHKNYRKLCNLLVDVEEWGQVVIINMLTRYCRTQFINPNQAVCQDFYDLILQVIIA
jgi:predicted nucleic acid-binding Zn ribbon protein